MIKYIVVENLRTDIREFASAGAAYQWIREVYFPDEMKALHVNTAREVNGERSYDF